MLLYSSAREKSEQVPVGLLLCAVDQMRGQLQQAHRHLDPAGRMPLHVCWRNNRTLRCPLLVTYSSEHTWPACSCCPAVQWTHT